MMIKKLTVTAVLASILAVAGYAPRASAIEISQMPVFVNPDIHPGNLVLVPSVEWPTIVSVANIQPEYRPAEEYVGYFDSSKCYSYTYSKTESERHFSPVSFTQDRTCDNAWSGNFLNWAATQTIDPFRKVLTGGYRVKDTPTQTWLEKARHTGQGGTNLYPNRRLTDPDIIQGATPFAAKELGIRIEGLGNRMRFTLIGSDLSSGVDFDPSIHPVDPAADTDPPAAYDVAVRVAVCTSSSLREPNCRQFSQGWKPQGLIQNNNSNLRYSIFGYLNDSDVLRDGAVMRSRQKFVGPTVPGVGPNPNAEWDPDTGVFLTNPNPDDVTDTNNEFGLTISHSGVINYLNMFGQLTNNNHKSLDPVSEMFYAAVRYIRGEQNVPPYTSGATQQHADGFPVITDWDKDGHDPVLSACQVNVALGIGDIYTHRDKNLPGPTSGSGEPAKPAAVSADTWIDVVEVTNRVGNMEGIGNIGNGSEFTGRSNSAYIAGLAYWANTTDMRPDDTAGEVTMSTHWVDVLEAQSLEGMARNQYALAAKYGGLKIPDDVDFDPMQDAIKESWWHTNGETLTPFGSRGNGQPSFKRPDNFYLAGNAAQMVESLSEAFENIIKEVGDVVSSISTTSQRLTTDTLVLQSGFSTGFWTGEIVALDPETGNQEWRASDNFRSNTARGSTFTADPSAVNNQGVAFNTSLSGEPLTRLEGGTRPRDMSATDLIAFILGDRSLENGTTVRFRGNHTLGDIINAGLVMSGPSNEGWTRLEDPFGEAYANYLDKTKTDRGRWVFTGANDGMLHAFNAKSGKRAFSYVPFGVLQNLGLLAESDYNESHRFYVDGGITVKDAYINGSWKTVLIGSLGAGGKSVFALDVTSPGSFSDAKVLWEYNAEHEADDDLGYTFGQPEITRLPDGTWVAVFGNGYNSTNANAVLYVVDLASGKLIEKVGFSRNIPDNGLSSPAVLLDSETQTQLQRVYAGDLSGRLWRADQGNNGLKPVNFNPVFDAGGDSKTAPHPHSITTRPTLAANGAGGINLFFGSGRLVNDTDRASTRIESFYSIRDTDEAVAMRDLAVLELEETADGERRITNPGAGEKGWKLELAVSGNGEGERVLTNSSILFGRLFFTTFEPFGDVCAAEGGLNRLYVVDALSGQGVLPGEQGAVSGVEIGEGTPYEVKPVIGAPSVPPEEPGDDTSPPPGDDDYQPPTVPDVDGPEDFCSTYGYPDPVTGEYMVLGTICDGRQIWRQAR